MRLFFFVRALLCHAARQAAMLEEQREKFFNNDESLEKAEGLKPEA